MSDGIKRRRSDDGGRIPAKRTPQFIAQLIAKDTKLKETFRAELRNVSGIYSSLLTVIDCSDSSAANPSHIASFKQLLNAGRGKRVRQKMIHAHPM